LASLFSGRPVVKNLAMTGEITLRGEVMPIGGLKEKALAAHRLGMKKVIIPKGNVKDLLDLPDVIRNEIDFIAVEHITDVLKKALTPSKSKNE
jgi:ATP-dependent Lon protease